MNSSIKAITALLLGVTLSGCSSVSKDTAWTMWSDGSATASVECASAVETVETHENLKLGRLVATPILSIATAGLLPVIVGANAALDYADRKNASNMMEACGKEPLKEEKILADVGTNTAINIALGSIDVGGAIPSAVTANATN